MNKQICAVYRSARHEGMYLYTLKADGFEKIPEALLERFGKPELAMTVVLTEQRQLARADIKKVMAALEAEGFYLQLPPQADSYMSELREKNSKL